MEFDAAPIQEGHEDMMKGRITVFSISGCPHCRAAKSLLKKKGASYVEINLDVYPERRPEMEMIAKKSSAPQIFFNDEHIGGNDSLQALNEAGRLDAKLKVVFETEPPPSAPAPPAPAALDDNAPALASEKDEFSDLVARMRAAVGVKDRRHLLVREHKQVFTGADAAAFLQADQKIGRPEAVQLGQKLMAKHFFHHVPGYHPFEDDSGRLYRFLEDEPELSRDRCLNFTGAVSQAEPAPAPAVGDQLRKLILAIYDQYVKRTEELQRLDLAALSRGEKLAFFVNIYNALVVHATALLGHGPENALQRASFFTSYCYVMGGAAYSLSEMENGVLRANRRPPYALRKPFAASDPRAKIALEEHEPLIHFALVCGAKSCPPIKTYKPAGVEDQLRSAGRSFFEGGGIIINDDSRTISLSKIIHWRVPSPSPSPHLWHFRDARLLFVFSWFTQTSAYHVDFGNSDAEVLRWIADLLDAKTKERLLGLVRSGKFKIAYQTYDWGSNSKH
eukprot:jgi/Mesen1/5934/ME000301S05070